MKVRTIFCVQALVVDVEAAEVEAPEIPAVGEARERWAWNAAEGRRRGTVEHHEELECSCAAEQIGKQVNVHGCL